MLRFEWLWGVHNTRNEVMYGVLIYNVFYGFRRKWNK